MRIFFVLLGLFGLTTNGVAETQDPGKLTYERFCVVCHRDGLIGAPKSGDAKDWEPRLKDRTIDDLLASATKGINAMPAKGTCTECSEDALRQAIEYMLPHHDKK